MYSSSITKRGGTKDEPDYVYYNASIVNNATGSTLNGQAYLDPQIKFNETRDRAIIENASDYHFSLLRFTMEGASKNLPLFIPSIQENTGQTNVNLTVYSMAVSYEQTFDLTGSPPPYYTVVATPSPRFIQYSPEIINAIVAPTPNTTANTRFLGAYDSAASYQVGAIVSLGAYSQINKNYPSPYYQVVSSLPSWKSGSYYDVNTTVLFGSLCYTSLYVIAVSVAPPSDDMTNWGLGVSNISPSATTTQWSLVSDTLGTSQDLSSKYYFVGSYQYVCDLWNATMLNCNAFSDTAVDLDAGIVISSCAYEDTYLAFYQAWVATVVAASIDPATLTFPYPTFGDFCNSETSVLPPVLVYDSDTSKFVLQADQDGFGTRILSYAPVPYSTISHPDAPSTYTVGLPIPPVCRLFFNENMYGLFSNFPSNYYNFPTTDTASQGSYSAFPVPINVVIPYSPYGTVPISSPTYSGPTVSVPIAVPDGYVYEITFYNNNFQNLLDTRLPPFTGVSPLGLIPISSVYFNIVYWLATQPMSSVDSFWSPISALVFTTSLLPVRPEATAPPVMLGQSNTGFSSATVPSAFQPLVSDYAMDQSINGTGSANYRQFILFNPVAEFRLSDFGASKQDIRAIDIQVFWRHRLTNNLYPITMFNLSSVSIKLMFRNKRAPEGKGE